MSSHVSVVGTVATRPNRFATPGRASVCSFRVAANERRYNREAERWEDGDTNWYTVVTFRGLADHAEQSFAVGDRIVVTGRLRVRQWSTAEKSGTSVEIDAEAVGHDVRWGVSSFRKHRSADADGSAFGAEAEHPEGGSPVPEFGSPDRGLAEAALDRWPRSAETVGTEGSGAEAFGLEDAGAESAAGDDTGRAGSRPAVAGSEDPDGGHTEEQVSADGFTPSVAA
ncbi:single-stranded DNA-binding protein [Leucobacter sp. GX24907]